MFQKFDTGEEQHVGQPSGSASTPIVPDDMLSVKSFSPDMMERVAIAPMQSVSAVAALVVDAGVLRIVLLTTMQFYLC